MFFKLKHIINYEKIIISHYLFAFIQCRYKRFVGWALVTRVVIHRKCDRTNEEYNQDACPSPIKGDDHLIWCCLLIID